MSFNTVSQLLAGYEGFMKDLESKNTPMKVARIKNGFLDGSDGGYRDIKINVIFQSPTQPDLRMICEVQLILNQYLFEKKKMHKLYSVIRDEVYYDMVVNEEVDTETEQGLDLKAQQFEPILNLSKDVETGLYTSLFLKCASNSELELIFLKANYGEKLICVNIFDRKVMFETASYPEPGFNNHWVKIKGVHYLSVHSDKNLIKFFVFDVVTKLFAEDEIMRVTLFDSDEIYCVEFAQDFENIFLVKNGDVLERISVSGDKALDSVNIKLEEKVKINSFSKQVALSDDGQWCAIGTGGKAFWYLVHIPNKKQYKLESATMTYHCAPSFINGGSEYIAIGGKDQCEIWDINTRSSLRVISGIGSVLASCSVNNILAVGCYDKVLRLYDVKTWDLVHSQNYGVAAYSLDLTSDLKYLTMSGSHGQKCIVLKISY